VTSNGARHDLGRAVDQDGNGLDLLVPRRRDQNAATPCCRKRLTGWTDGPRVLITDQLKRDGAAKQDIRPGVAHRPPRDRNNRAEKSHQPTRQRARRRQGCQSPGHAPRVLAADGPMAPHVRPRRQRVAASASRQEMPPRFQRWGELTGTGVAASEQLRSKASPRSSLCCPQTRSA